MKPSRRDEVLRALHALVAGVALGAALAGLARGKRPSNRSVSPQ